jgi:hypothetical protein
MIEGSGSIPLTSGSGSRRPKTCGSGSATLSSCVNDNEGSKIVNIFTIFGNERKYEKALIRG